MNLFVKKLLKLTSLIKLIIILAYLLQSSYSGVRIASPTRKSGDETPDVTAVRITGLMHHLSLNIIQIKHEVKNSNEAPSTAGQVRFCL